LLVLAHALIWFCCSDMPMAAAQVVRTSERSLEVTERVAPLMRARVEAMGHAWGDPVFFRIIKEEDALEVWVGGERWDLLGTWPICAWAGELGPKLAEGDMQSPEGFYTVPPGRMNPNSQWHLGMDIGYPNAYDRHHERTGSYIVIHGVCGSSGCFAMTNPLVEELWVLAEAALNAGQRYVRVHVFPFRMTDERLQREAASPWFEFWANLNEGWRWFETHGEPPNVEVQGGRYVFDAPG
jgi:murein L,D-transpeptidase YafK